VYDKSDIHELRMEWHRGGIVDVGAFLVGMAMLTDRR